MIYNNILEPRNTPLVGSTACPTDGAEILVKLRANVGGSIKTRTAYNMIVDADSAA